jgi:hypothetical protein
LKGSFNACHTLYTNQRRVDLELPWQPNMEEVKSDTNYLHTFGSCSTLLPLFLEWKCHMSWNGWLDILINKTLVENMVKKTAIVFPLQFFWPLWYAVTKRMQFFFLGLPAKILRIWGLLIYCYKGLENTSPTVYCMPPEFQNCNCKTKKTSMQSFSGCKSRWSKEPQWENDCGSFLHCFLLVEWCGTWEIKFILGLHVARCQNDGCFVRWTTLSQLFSLLRYNVLEWYLMWLQEQVSKRHEPCGENLHTTYKRTWKKGYYLRH